MLPAAKAEEREHVSQELAALPVCLWRENPNRLVNLWEMYHLVAHKLLSLLDELRDLEIDLAKSLTQYPTAAEQAAVNVRFIGHVQSMRAATESLQLTSSQKQIRRIADYVSDKIAPGNVVSAMLKELRLRIREDLENHVYLCVPEGSARKFFAWTGDDYRVKVPSELMDPAIVARFPSASDDIDGTFRCLVLDCYPAAMFHLMRVMEAGVLGLAKIAGLKDPKPSWGSVLEKVEKLVLRTKYDDLDPKIQPYRGMMEAVLPQMQAIQRAWRNKFAHVGGMIIPTGSPITEQVALEILTAVEGFMRQLAHDLPPEA